MPEKSRLKTRTIPALLLILSITLAQPAAASSAETGGSVESPSVESPSVESPSVESPSVESPSVEAPSVEAPSVESPSVESPSVKSPSVKSPSVKSPSVKSPSVESPSVESPSVESPSVEAPSVEATSEESQPEEQRGIIQGTLGMAENLRDDISGKVTATGDAIDTFFGGKRIMHESGGSYVRLRQGAVYKRGGEIFYEQDIKLKIAIPRTKDRLNLTIGDEPEDESENREVKNISDTIDSSTVRDQPVGLGYIIKAKRALNISISAGASFGGGAVNYYSKLRGRKSFYPGKWEIRLSEVPFWTKLRGYGATTGIDFERNVGERHFFRAAGSATWYDDTESWDLAENLTLFHQLNSRDIMAYNVGGSGVRANGSTSIVEYHASIIFRRNLYKGWLFGEIQPTASFPKAENFHLIPSIAARLEVVFGKP